jgi:hypothetical protein
VDSNNDIGHHPPKHLLAAHAHSIVIERQATRALACQASQLVEYFDPASLANRFSAFH